MKTFLQLASRKTKTLELGEGGELTVRTDLSKGAFRSLLSRMPEDMSDDNRGFTPVEADDFTTGVFEALVVGWNAVDEDGKQVPATADNYLQLPREVTTVIDTTLMEYFNTLTMSEQDKSSSETASE